MLTRKVWPMTLGILFVGSATIASRGDDTPHQSKFPSIQSQSRQSQSRQSQSRQSQSSGKLTAESSEKAPNSEKPPQSTPGSVRKPKELNDTVKKALEYLISQQNDDGGFGQGGGWRQDGKSSSGRLEGADAKDRSDVGNTCMVALTLTRAGNSPKEGKYSNQLTKAIIFVETNVEASDKDSLYVTPIRDTQLQRKIGTYADTFLTALILSELKGQMQDSQSEERLTAALNKTIGKIESNQQVDGRFAGNGGWASVLSQGLCSKALSRASQKGILVKPETISRDLNQTVAQLTPVKAGKSSSRPVGSAGLGPRFSAGALPSETSGDKSDAGVQLYSLSANGGRLQDVVSAKKLRKNKAEADVNNPTADKKTKDAARDELKELEEAEVANGAVGKVLAANLKNAAFVQGFGNNGGEEFLSYMNISETLLVQGGEAWDKWDRQVSENIGKIQNEDGSWSGHHCITGRIFCTSAALLTLMADRAPVAQVTDGYTPSYTPSVTK